MDISVKKKQLNAYLFSSDRKKGLEAFLSNVEASQYYTLIYELNDIQAKKDLEAIRNLEKKVKDLLKGNYKYHQWTQVVDKRYNLVRLELENNTTYKKDIIDHFQKTYLNAYFEFKPPAITKPLEASKSINISPESSYDVFYDEIKKYTDIPTNVSKWSKLHKDWEDWVKNNNYNILKKDTLSTFNIDFGKLNHSQARYIIENNPYIFEFDNNQLMKIIKACSLFNRDNYSDSLAFNSMKMYLTKDQLYAIFNNFKNVRNQVWFCQTVLKKRFFKWVQKLNGSKTPSKCSKIFLKIYREFKKEFSGFFISLPELELNTLKFNLLSEYLKFSLRDGRTDFALFTDWLNIPNTSSLCRTKNINKVRAECNPQKLTTFFGITNLEKDMGVEELVQEYMYKLIGQKKCGYADFKDYFDENTYNQMYVDIMYFLGEPQDNQVKKIFNKKDSTIRFSREEEVILKPDLGNKIFFEKNENIVITMKIKNIPSLMMKVFQIDTIKYYKKYNKEIESDINLDGLVAAYDKVFNFDDIPKENLICKDFPIDNISNNDRGVFIIDFIGNTQSCRMIIKRGQLKYIDKVTDSGTKVYILDENNQVCKIPGTGILYQHNFYPCDPNNGEIIFGFELAGQDNAILINENHGEFIKSFRIADEYVQLKTSVIIPRESCIKGNIAKILVKPNLSRNGFTLSINEEHQLKINIKSTDYSGKIHSLAFENLTCIAHQFLEFDYKIPNQIESLTVQVFCVYTSKKGKTQELQANYQKSFNARNIGFADMYLQLDNLGYFLHVLGKNGEPKRYCKVNLDFHNEFMPLSTSTNFTTICQTDEYGRIFLGQLKGIAEVSATLNPRRGINLVHRDWFLQNSFKSVANKITSLEGKCLILTAYRSLTIGETLKIPVELNNEANLTKKSISLIEVDNSGDVISWITTGIKYIPNASSNDNEGNIELNLPKGLYKCYVKKFDICYDITILSKKNLVTIDDNIVKGNTIIQNPMKLSRLELNAFEFNLAQSKIKLKLKGHTQNTKAIIYLKQFKENELSRENIGFFNTLSFLPQTTRTIPKSLNIYLSGRLLHEEYNYVLQRSHAKKFPGNSLEKPTLLCKRMYIQDTTNQDQKAKAGTEFQKKPIQGSVNNQISNITQKNDTNQTIYAPYLDFLLYPARLYTNIVFNEEGEAEIIDPNLRNYCLCDVIITDPNLIINKEFLLMTEEVDKKKEAPRALKTRRIGGDSNTAMFNSDQGFLKKSEYAIVEKNKEFNIKDIMNTDYTLYDSLDKIYWKLFKDASRESIEFEKWKFVLLWDTLTNNQKDEYYNKYNSHELNLFIWSKDKQYFNKIIRPYIQNKFNKTLIDYFILNEKLNKTWFSYTNIKNSSLFELMILFIMCQDQNLRTRIAEFAERKIESEENKEQSTNGLKVLESFGANLNSGQEIYIEREFYYNNLAKYTGNNLIWAHLIKQINHLGIQRQDMEIKTFDYLPLYVPSKMNILETLLALSFINLPIKLKIPTSIVNNEDMGAIIKANNNCILYRDYFAPVPINLSKSVILNKKLFLNSSQRIYLENNEDLFIDVKYRFDIAITNISTLEQDFKIVYSLPSGSIPIEYDNTIHVETIKIPAFGTKTLESISFYYPETGTSIYSPVYISNDDDTIIAASEKQTFRVKESGKLKPKKIKDLKEKTTTSNKSGILEILATEPILKKEYNFSFNDIYHLLKEKKFYEDAIKILKNRLIFDMKTYAFSIYHYDYDTFYLYLNNTQQGRFGEYFISKSLINLRETVGSRYLDYYPLVNSRIHALGKNKKILNNKFKEFYLRFLKVLAEKPKLSLTDKLWLVYYALLQDKIEQAIEYFKNIVASDIPDDPTCLLQFDYMRCYMDFYIGAPKFSKALSISEKYLNYPIISWQKMFANVNEKVKKALNLQSLPKLSLEIKDINNADELIKYEQNKDLREQKFAKDIVKGAGSIEFDIKDNQLYITTMNIRDLAISFYKIDYEIFFSKSPFNDTKCNECHLIKSSNILNLSINNNTKTSNLMIPPDLQKENLYVIIKGNDNIQREKIYFKSQMIAYVDTQNKLIQITDLKENPLQMVYVKIYYQYQNNQNITFRDGYTDFKGRFKYLDSMDKITIFKSIRALSCHQELGYNVIKIM